MGETSPEGMAARGRGKKSVGVAKKPVGRPAKNNKMRDWYMFESALFATRSFIIEK